MDCSAGRDDGRGVGDQRAWSFVVAAAAADAAEELQWKLADSFEYSVLKMMEQ